MATRGRGEEGQGILEGYRPMLTIRMLIYRIISSALQSAETSSANTLRELFSRLPSDAPSIVVDALGPNRSQYSTSLS